jgi:hypothetical protein
VPAPGRRDAVSRRVGRAPRAKLGTVDDISIGEGWVDIKKRQDSADLHPEALFAHDHIGTEVLADALLRIGEYVADHGLEGEGPYQAARDLLLRHAPRVGGQPLRNEGETPLAAALRLAIALDGVNRRGKRTPITPKTGSLFHA